MSSPRIKRARLAEKSTAGGSQDQEHQELRDVLKIGPCRASTLIERYKGNALAVMRNDPYAALTLPGFGYVTCDAMADELGIPASSPVRARARIKQEVQEVAARKGWSGQSLDTLRDRCPDVDEDILLGCLTTLQDEGALQVCTIEGRTYAIERRLYTAECDIATRLRRLLNQPPPAWAPRITEETIVTAGRRLGLQPSPSQTAALLVALRSNVAAISGAAGTGKTTLMRLLLGVLESVQPANGTLPAVRLVAPTGLAADRLSQATGRDAMTIHRSLSMRWSPGSTVVLIVDEATMVGSLLCQRLLQSLSATSRAVVVFVGDEHQLCSVEPGAVFSSLLRCPRIPSHRLTEVHRQDSNSRILEFACGIRNGCAPDMGTSGDLHFIDVASEQDCLDALRDVVCNTLPGEGYLPDDVQVLACSKRQNSLISVPIINQRMQQWVHAEAPHIEIGGVTYHVGDRLMHTQNDYDRRIFNGNVGTLTRVVPGAADSVWVDFDGDVFAFTQPLLGHLKLAHCLTVHKAQGSEFAVVVLVTLGDWMLSRNLLYTAVTRARRKLIVISNRKTLWRAIQKTEPRVTGPSVLLQQLQTDHD